MPPVDGVRVGPGDDAAVLADGTAVTIDSLVEGVHWDHRLSPEDVGFKTLAVSVSDLAAMGAIPTWAVLALSLPDPLDLAWVERFAVGFAEAAAQWSIRLVGGDTTRTRGPRVVTAAVGGLAPDRPLTRAGGSAGETLWVTGTLGLAGAGWQWADPPDAALAALRRPDPPVALARELLGRATATMDLSDGLARDLPRLCAASGVGAVIHRAALPAHPALGADPWELQLGGGEDYQLLFSAPAHAGPAILAAAAALGRAVTPIGQLTEDRTLRLDADPWPALGFAHFAVRS